MDRKEEIKKELEELSPFLSKLKKENPFEVPANYFEQLPGQIMEQAKLTPVERPAPRVSWLDHIGAAFSFMLRPQVAFALICLAALSWTGIFMWKNQSQLQAEVLEQEDTFIEEYIAAHLDEFDAEILAQVVFEEGEDDDAMLNDLDMDDDLMNEILEELDDVDLEELL